KGGCVPRLDTGARSTSASAYLHPALNTRSNLDVLLHSQVTQVLQNTRSMRRKKVHPISMFNFGPLKFGVPVILSAGSIGTPQLLMLSGIGPKQQLQSLGISSLVDLEDVGANLQDQSI
ncbi:glucose-methanol-choline oxidoreductase, partial [Mycena polygramma]